MALSVPLSRFTPRVGGGSAFFVRRLRTSPVRTALTNFPMHDGSRKFAELPEACSWEEFRQHIQRLSGAVITDYDTDHITEMWLDFSFRGHTFSVNNQYGDFWFFVSDPSCPDDILIAVIEHCEPLLPARRA